LPASRFCWNEAPDLAGTKRRSVGNKAKDACVDSAWQQRRGADASRSFGYWPGIRRSWLPDRTHSQHLTSPKVEAMLDFLRSCAADKTSRQAIDPMIDLPGTRRIVQQQNISRSVTMRQYRGVREAACGGKLAAVQPAGPGTRAERGVDGLTQDVARSLLMGSPEHSSARIAPRRTAPQPLEGRGVAARPERRSEYLPRLRCSGTWLFGRMEGQNDIKPFRTPQPWISASHRRSSGVCSHLDIRVESA
jgi:hypothetical protein